MKQRLLVGIGLFLVGVAVASVWLLMRPRTADYRGGTRWVLAPAASVDADAASLDRARGTLRQRLDYFGLEDARLVSQGRQLVIDTPPGAESSMSEHQTALTSSGRWTMHRVADEAEFFDALLLDSAAAPSLPPGFALRKERASVGLGADGNPKTRQVTYVTVTPESGESEAQALARLQTWAAHLPLPEGLRVGFERKESPDPGGTRFESWRTYWLATPAVLTGGTIENAEPLFDEMFETWSVVLRFDEAGARVLEHFTATSLRRRAALVLDDMVLTAPLIMARIPGGQLVLSMAPGKPEDQRRAAHDIAGRLTSPPLPYALSLVSQERIP